MEVECLSYSMESEKQPRTLVMTDWIKVSLTIRNSAGFPTFA